MITKQNFIFSFIHSKLEKGQIGKGYQGITQSERERERERECFLCREVGYSYPGSKGEGSVWLTSSLR